MKVPFPASLLICIFISCLVNSPALATKKSYIVYLGEHAHGPNPTPADLERATNSHHEMLGSVVGGKDKAKESMFYSYNQHINGFAAILDEKQAQEIAKQPGVISVFENKRIQMHTTRSWEFLGLEKEGGNIALDSLWKKANFGDGIIIGNIDSGVCAESESFRDEGLGPVPSRWRGICQSGFTEEGVSDEIKCNRKVIGARYFGKGIQASTHTQEEIHSDEPKLSKFLFKSARDYSGHGTSTLSVAAGAFVGNISEMGNRIGTAKGGAPKARVAAYKTLWDGYGGAEADVLAAIDAAIYDGVDVITASLGGTFNEYFECSLSIGGFHAMKHGIPIIAAVGNYGPGEATAGNTAPWLFSVGASTMDRDFYNYVTLGNKMVFKGSSVSFVGFPPQKLYPLISGEEVCMSDVPLESKRYCKFNRYDPDKITGNIIVCVMKLSESDVHSAGGTILRPKSPYYQDISETQFGIIMINDKEDANDTLVGYSEEPSSRLNYPDSLALQDYMKSTKNPVAHIGNVIEEIKMRAAPMIPLFSARGPCKVEPHLIKPDVVAPGVNIIAAAISNSYTIYHAVTGTSIACPAVAGVVALLKVIHPRWSPAEIKSAIMTTAIPTDTDSRPILDENGKLATPFDMGSGNIQPELAANPGLVYDLKIDDYLSFLCSHGYKERTISIFYPNKPYVCRKQSTYENFNYPSIAVPDIKDSITISRVVKNVGEPGTYNVKVQEIPGVSIEVLPKSLTFGKQGEKKKFDVVFKRNGSVKVGSGFAYGSLTWSDGSHNVRSPIAVKL